MIFLAGSFLLPAQGRAQTTDVSAQIQALLAQLQTLQTQLIAIRSQSISGSATTLPTLVPVSTQITVSSTSPAIAFSCSVSDLNGLRRSSRGSAVSKLQGILKSRGYMQISPTGFFGTITQAALKSFQGENGLDISGVVDDATIQTLDQSGPCAIQPLTAIPILPVPTTINFVPTSTPISVPNSNPLPTPIPIPVPISTPISTPTLISTSTSTPPISTSTPPTSTSTPPAPTSTPVFSVSSPASGATSTWSRGGSYNIQWSNAGFIAPSVRLSLYRNGSYLDFIAGDTPNSGNYSWRVPTSLADGSNYSVRVFYLPYPNNWGDSGQFTISN